MIEKAPAQRCVEALSQNAWASETIVDPRQSNLKGYSDFQFACRACRKPVDWVRYYVHQMRWSAYLAEREVVQ